MNLLGLRSVRRNNGMSAPRANDKAVATSPPLGGASEYFHGRSSDSAGSNLLARLPRPFDPVSSWAFVPAYRCGAVPDSHRIPFSSSSRRNLGIKPLYLGATLATSPFLVDMSPTHIRTQPNISTKQLSLQTSHIDHKPVLHIALQHPLIGLGQLVYRGHLNL